RAGPAVRRSAWRGRRDPDRHRSLADAGPVPEGVRCRRRRRCRYLLAGVRSMNISIFDYGTGNLHSLAKALARGGRTVRIDARVADALAADAIVLPGVGNFGAAAERLG